MDHPNSNPAPEMLTAEVTPRPSALTVAPPAALASQPGAAFAMPPMRTGSPAAMKVPSGTLYILMKDYTIGVLTAPVTSPNAFGQLWVLVVTDSQSVGENRRRQFSSTQFSSTRDGVASTVGVVPYVRINSFSDAPNTMPAPGTPDFGESNTSSELDPGYDYYWLSDEITGAAPRDTPVQSSYYVFYDAASGGNEVGRVLCSRVLQWSDQMPLLLGS